MGPVMVIVLFDRFIFETKDEVALSCSKIVLSKEKISWKCINGLFLFLSGVPPLYSPSRVGEMYIVIVKCYLIWIVKQNLKSNAEAHPKSKPPNVARLPKSPRKPQL